LAAAAGSSRALLNAPSLSSLVLRLYGRRAPTDPEKSTDIDMADGTPIRE
jgi:hypothetical protein